MRVAMYYSNRDIRLEDMPRPKIGEGEILMRIESSGICGSDVMEWYRIHKVPLVLGHEVAGEITEVGKGVKGYKRGDRIAVSHHVPCGKCHYCINGHETACETLRKTNFHPGGFSEFVRIPAINVEKGVYSLPKEVSYDLATFIEPVACVLRGQRKANFKSGQTVLVIGSGISGLLHIRLARAMGARWVIATDISDYRLEAAKRSGADYIFKAKEYGSDKLKKVNDGRLADLVILCTGAVSAINQGLNSLERGGTVLFFAPTDKGVTIPLSINDIFWRNDVTLTTSYAGSPEDHREALELIRSGKVKVDDLITHKLPLAETQKGFELVMNGNDSIKVIIKPQE